MEIEKLKQTLQTEVKAIQELHIQLSAKDVQLSARVDQIHDLEDQLEKLEQVITEVIVENNTIKDVPVDSQSRYIIKPETIILSQTVSQTKKQTVKQSNSQSINDTRITNQTSCDSSSQGWLSHSMTDWTTA